jgi:hypothetical protein
MAGSSDGSPTTVSSVVWDAAGVNESFGSAVSTQGPWSTYGYSSIFRLANPTAKSAAITVTYSASQSERIMSVWVGTGLDTGTPNGTIGTATGTGNTLSATATTSTGQLVLLFGHAISNGPLVAFNSPTGTERNEAATVTNTYDTAGVQEQTASGSSTAPSWTLNGNQTGWSAFAIPLNDAGGGSSWRAAFAVQTNQSIG